MVEGVKVGLVRRFVEVVRFFWFIESFLVLDSFCWGFFFIGTFFFVVDDGVIYCSCGCLSMFELVASFPDSLCSPIFLVEFSFSFFG